MNFTEGCSICGEELVYLQGKTEMKCDFCGSVAESNVSCPDKHFICDGCHRSNAVQLIEKYCNKTTDTDPFQIADYLMKSPVFHMHGPEHHFLVPAVLIAAYYNLIGEESKKIHKLTIARKRAETVPGGYCGTHGNCGAAVGAGIFISIITGATPLSEKEWYLSNRMTGETLLEVAESGGPRCCKRDTFISIESAVRFLKKHLDTDIPVSEIKCQYSGRNKQCKFEDCMYYKN